MHPVRQKILEILKRHRHATVGDLAAELDMAPVSVRHHLDLLIGDGLVCTPRVRRGSGAGRPKRVYALTPEAATHFPNNYRQLADESLNALKQLVSEEQMFGVMQTLASRAAASAPSDLETLPLPDRIEAIAAFLTEQGFMAGVEKNGDGFLLHACNCPYAQLADSHPELCQMDLQLISDLTGLAPQRIAHITEGDGRCTYRLEITETMPVQDAPLMISVPVGELAHV
ncbi:MAG TPA: ArsR family transcriptional regulator [Caldilineae bacterium]|nr:ArsR family transcriptional regulator [Caldilineae bacterium]